MSIQNVDLCNLPVHVKWSDTRQSLGPTIFAGVLFTGITAPLLFKLLQMGSQYSIWVLVLLVLILGSFTPMLAAILHQEEIRVNKDTVYYKKRGLFGIKKWEKPFSDFFGILLFYEVRHNHTPSQRYTNKRYFLQLYADARHWIWLFYGDDKGECFDKWRSFARALNLTPLVKIEKKIEKLTMEDAVGFDFPE